MMLKLAKPIFVLAIAALSFASCQPEPEPEPVVIPKTYGKIQVFHAAIDAPAVDFFVDDTKINSDSLPYSKGTPYYSAELTTGKKTVYKVTVSKTGQAITTDSLTMNSTDVGYSVFIYKDKDAAKTIRTLYTPDNLLAPAAGKAKLRFVHLISDANVNLDIEIVPTGSSASTSNTYPNVAFPKISDFIELASGSYDVKIKVSGTVNTLLSPTITVEAGKIYTLVGRGYAQLANKLYVTPVTNK